MYVGLGAVGVVAEDEFVGCESAGVVWLVGEDVDVVVSDGEAVGVAVEDVSANGASSAYAASGAPPIITTDIAINSND